jgi:hypothetical protein
MFAQQVHPSDVAAMIIEPILGEGGFLTPPPSKRAPPVAEQGGRCSGKDLGFRVPPALNPEPSTSRRAHARAQLKNPSKCVHDALAPKNAVFLLGLRELCDKHGILLIFDEVRAYDDMTGLTVSTP